MNKDFKRNLLSLFVMESNRIEGIPNVRAGEIEAHEEFLASAGQVCDVEALVNVLQPGATLRRRIGQDVRVGSHVAPVGGMLIEPRLFFILDNSANLSPWKQHCEYEVLHPFMDGNGRSGRAVWLRRMGRLKNPASFLEEFHYQVTGLPVISYDFDDLRQFYYRALSNYRTTERR